MTGKVVKNIFKNGYSLVELLAVIAIMGVMAAVAVTSYQGTKQSTALEKAVQQLALDLRRAQNMAINTAVFNGSVPPGGYGIHIETPSTTSYVIYADTYTTDVTPPVISDKIYTSGPGFDGIVATKTFNSPISISAITNSVTDIDFLPPNPTVYLNGDTVINTTTITLRYGAAGPSKTIKVNRLTGQISVN